MQEQALHAVRSSYAASVQWVFYRMAVSMAVLTVLAIAYPTKERRQAHTDPLATDTLVSAAPAD